MRNKLAILALLSACTVLVPVASEAQQRGQPQQAQSTQPWQCDPADPARAFQRSVRADSLAVRQAGALTGPGGERVTGGTARSREYPEYDVVLHIPNLCVNRIFLKVDSLTAKLNLDARIANLVQVRAGVDVLIGEVDLTVEGVRAQVLLLVDLDDVVYIVDRTLTFIDNHPEIVQQLGSTLQNTAGSVGGLVGGVVQGLLLGTSTNALGQTVQRVVNQATGSILERTVSAAGQVVAERTVGALTSLPVVSNTRNQAGNTVRQVRDTTGRVIEFVTDSAGKILSSRLLDAATR